MSIFEVFGLFSLIWIVAVLLYFGIQSLRAETKECKLRYQFYEETIKYLRDQSEGIKKSRQDSAE